MSPTQAESVSRKILHYLKALLSHWHFKYRLANLVCGPFPEFASGVLRGRLYRLAGFTIDPNAYIMGNLTLVAASPRFYNNLVIKSGVIIGDHVTINLDAEVYIGTNVAISPRTLIYTATHGIGPGSSRRQAELVAKAVRIEDGSWLGLGTIILPGITIGRGSIVAAGAVVTQDVEPNTLVEGNPARPVRKLPWADR